MLKKLQKMVDKLKSVRYCINHIKFWKGVSLWVKGCGHF